MNKIRLDEDSLRKIIRESLENMINEVGVGNKLGGFVGADNDMKRLRAMSDAGQKTFQKGNRTVSVDNELARRRRQMDTFGKGASHDLSLKYGKDRAVHQRNLDDANEKVESAKNWLNYAMKTGADENQIEMCKKNLEDAQKRLASLTQDTNGFRVSSTNDGYRVDSPDASAYSSVGGRGFNFNDDVESSANRGSQLQGVTDAMMGRSEELNPRMDDHMKSIQRQQRNVQALRDYDAVKEEADASHADARMRQSEYDRSPFFKKWFSDRPVDNTVDPEVPKWEPNENGEFDGYFAHHNPADYDKDMENVRQRRDRYNDALKGFRG